MTGGRNDEPSMEELLASIRRIISESQITPIDAQVVEPPAVQISTHIDGEHDDFELPAMFRKEKESAATREPGFVVRLTDAIRGEPPAMADAPALPPAAPPPVSALSSRDAFGAPQLPFPPSEPRADESSHVPSLLSLGENPFFASPQPSRDGNRASRAPSPQAKPAQSGAAGDVSRVMVPLKDTVIARMGQRVDGPALPIKQRRHVSAATTEEFCYGASTFPRMDRQHGSLLDAERRDRPIPRASIGLNYLLGSEAGEASDDSDIAYLPPQFAPVEFPEVRSRETSGATADFKIAESTSELLRPLLMQWLDDNLHQAFTRALHEEVAASAKGDKV